jgi:chorismate synthase
VRLRWLTAGESHGPALAVTVEGLPAGLPVDRAALDAQLRRRQGGHGRGGRMAIEADAVEILAGVRHGRALGSPVTLVVRNLDHANWADVMSPDPQPPEARERRRLRSPRPGHADLAGALKYLEPDLRSVMERASARETAARVAAAALVRPLLAAVGVEVRSHVRRIGGAALAQDAPVAWEALAAAERSPVRCVDPGTERSMVAEIDEARRGGDTLGGQFEVVARAVPPGLGGYAQWDVRLDGRIGQAFLSIPAVKAVAIGDGLAAAGLPGSAFHDEILYEPDRGFLRSGNRAGGLEGGVTNGEDVRVQAVVKPIPTLRRPLRSVDLETRHPAPASFERSDTCVVPAAAVVGEAMLALVLADAALDKFGGDSMAEFTDHVQASRDRLRAFTAPPAR